MSNPPLTGSSASLHQILVGGGAFERGDARRIEDGDMTWEQWRWSASSDAELRTGLERARRRGVQRPEVDLRGGTLRQVLAARSELPAAGDRSIDVDVVAVRIDGNRHWFTSHLVARHRRVGGRVVAVTNLPWQGGALANPHSDPTDGLVEVFDAELTALDHLRLRADRQRGAGPASSLRRRRSQVAAIDIELGRPTPVWLDGTEVAVARFLSIAVEPGALRCWS